MDRRAQRDEGCASLREKERGDGQGTPTSGRHSWPKASGRRIAHSRNGSHTRAAARADARGRDVSLAEAAKRLGTD